MKRYIKVSVICETDGTMIPKQIIWDESRSYPIDAVTDIRAENAGQNDKKLKYTCLIWGKRKTLYYGNKRWYIEA